MRILLTGGAGYVGSACLRWLLRHGHEAIAYDDLSAGNAAAVPGDRLIVGDILDGESLARALRDERSDAVMHFAAVASVPESIALPELYWRVNVVGTKSVLDVMREVGVDKILFSSSAATFSFDNEMPLTEDSETKPHVPYGSTKLAAERMIAEYATAYGASYTILRYFNASGADPDGDYGEDRGSETHLIPLTLYAAIGRSDRVLIFGDDWDTRDGTCVRDYVHTDDLADAHQLAVERLEPGRGVIYNIGCGHGVTVLEVLRACEQVVGRPIPHEVADRRPGDPGTLVASPERLRTELGWTPSFDKIEDIVSTAWKWLDRHPRGYADRAA